VMFDGRGPKGGVGNLAGMTMASLPCCITNPASGRHAETKLLLVVST
jgi:hypothetical protein